MGGLSRAIVVAVLLLAIPSALASDTPAPATVTIAGSLQSELGCPDDWQPACVATQLSFDAGDGVWQRTFDVPAGTWEYKAPLNGAWDENYGAGGSRNGANIGLTLGAARTVKFYYDHGTHWVTDDVNSTIAVAPGNFQSELGCPGDWDPGCLRSWLQDPDGDGILRFSTTAIPAGSYEAKVALRESWDENYGAGGVPNGPNILFTVPANATTTFSYDAASHVLTITTQTAGPAPDDNVEWDGVRHDSRSLLYRTPGGAVPAGTPVKLRVRTFHEDVTAVRLRLFDVEADEQRIVQMTRAAAGVDCYEPALAARECDFWEAALQNAEPNNLWYRFIVTDGADTDYYADGTAALDGGLGAMSDEPVDWSYALTVHVPGFAAPGWARDTVLYQIFPDRFRNGNPRNDPQTGDPRYDDPVLALPWGTKPEGYCRNYATASCPWRFDDTPPDWSPVREGPRGRDYMGGDLRGVADKLDYLRDLGVTAIYFNPIFASQSNHGYDTSNYRQIDPGLGTLKDFRDLVAAAKARGIRVILDGVFNHMSSDSPEFDRYGRYDDEGACESLSSPFRPWFVFTTQNVPCGTADYVGWFGFDSIPVLEKTNAEVQEVFIRSPNSVARQWLERGAAGWRLDVSGDPSFPEGYWEAFRDAVGPDALSISETWPKDTTTLRMLRGDRLDTTMNYRLRDAVIGLLAPGSFDSKGLPDSGRPLAPSEVAARLASIREDYADAAYYSLMNLLDSHDTERALWTLTPGAETPAAREADAANVAAGKRRLRLASLIQFTVPGMPTVYYGDEVGVTGDDDPDDRRTYPWADTGGSPDAGLLAHYRSLAEMREENAALRDGDFRVLLADDGEESLAYGRKTTRQAAVVAINRGGVERTLEIPVGGYLPDGTAFDGATVAGGVLRVTVGPLAGRVLLTGQVDLEPPAAPTGLRVTGEGDGRVALAWDAVAGAAGYEVYASPLSGGGFVREGATAGTSFEVTGLANALDHYFVVRALDGPGNASAPSNEVAALPHLEIGWANLQWPPSMTHVISATDRTDDVFGQVWIEGVTNRPGPTEGLRAQLGQGPDGSDPAGAGWTWVEARFNVDAGNNDEFVGSLLPEAVGTFDYAYRYSTTNGRDWVYADLDGIPYSSAQAGNLAVLSSGDATAPAVPSGLRVLSASPSGIELAWDAVAGDPTLHGYEVRRDGATLELVTGTTFADLDVVEGQTYRYAVRSVDTSLNRSADSAEVSATAARRTVSLVLDVTVPATTDGTGRSVYIAGTLDRLDGSLPQWDPAGVVLTRTDATSWTIALSGEEGTQLEYKYVLGDWLYVEKDGGCGEVANRQLTLAFGAGGTQTVADSVPNWRNVPPCGN